MVAAGEGGPATAFNSPTFEKDVSIHVDPKSIGSASAASISPSGRDVVLASRDGLHIIDLDNPYSPPRHISNRSEWEVADVQWSPFASRASWIVSTSNQKALVYNLDLLSTSSKPPIQFTLHGHQRAITDINFSAHDEDQLATCAIDSFIYLWDLRTGAHATSQLGRSGTVTVRTSSGQFADWTAGASQVKWNRQDENILASAHDKYLHIWDRRKGSVPVTTINAHENKIYGIDWNRTSSTSILTCSLDETMKIWDYASTTEDGSIQAQRTFKTQYPVWRARHTPFGSGILAMPRPEVFSALYLYDRRYSNELRYQRATTKQAKDVAPVHVFGGHDKKGVQEFLWRTRGSIENGIDDRDFQLVSWGNDQRLLLHRVKPEYLQGIGFQKGQAVYRIPRLTRQGAPYRTYRDIDAPNFNAHLSRNPVYEQTGLPVPEAVFGDIEWNIEADTPPAIGSPQVAKGQLSSLFKSDTTAHPTFPHTLIKEARGTMKAPLPGRGKKHEPVNAIQWMSGVKIGHRDAGFKLKKEDGSPRHPLGQPDVFDAPESLAEEIKYVGTKYSKLNFEGVDPMGRTATVSLNGPWGADGKFVFIRLSLKFPPTYPKESTPDITVEKTTSAITDETIKKLHSEMQELADFHLEKKRGCFEAIISYALGERSLQESIKFLSKEDDFGIIPGATDESSSEDDDYEGDDPNFLGSTEELTKGAPASISLNANANVPVPKQTVASWTCTGQLVTVVPPRPEPQSLFSNALLRTTLSSKSVQKRQFLQSIRSAGNKLTSHDEEVSDTDSGSWSSSTSSGTSSSDSDNEEKSMSGLFQPPAAWRRATLKFQKFSHRSGSATTSQPINKPKSVIRIMDFGDEIIPDQRPLAEEYMVYGDGPTVCAHNGEVARRHGFAEIADIWELCKLILSNEVPLEVLPQQIRREQVLILARRSLVSIKRKDSGLDLQFDEADAVNNPKLKGRLKWGRHPIATWLIPAIFDYFERQADVQMLAMLSCIFSEPAAHEGTAAAVQRLRHSQLPMSMKAPAYSLDYFASADAAWSLYKPTLSIPSTPVHSRFAIPNSPFDRYTKIYDTYGSHGSSNGPWGSSSNPSDPVTPYSTGTTPPTTSRTNTLRSFIASNATAPTTPFSTSPEQHALKKSSSNLATAFASLSRPFSITASSSPPTQSKPRGDGDLSTSAPTSGITWGTNTFISSSSTSAHPSTRSRNSKRHSISNTDRYLYESDSDDDFVNGGRNSEVPLTPLDGATEKGPTIKVTLKNQNQFDDEASVSTPLLAQDKEWLYRQWRTSYGEQLRAWGLISKRAEVLKFNGLVSYWESFEDRVTQTTQDVPKVEPPIKPVARAETTPNPPTTTRSSLAPPERPTIRRTPSASPRPTLTSSSSFPFNPEAREFLPATKPPPLPLTTTDPIPEAAIHSPNARTLVLGSLFHETLEIEVFGRRGRGSPVKRGGGGRRKGAEKGGEGKVVSCSVCWVRVDGRFLFCAACGCVSHVGCVGGADGDDDEGVGFEEGMRRAAGCVAGCGCECEGVGEDDGEWWEREEEVLEEEDFRGREWWVEEEEEEE